MEHYRALSDNHKYGWYNPRDKYNKDRLLYKINLKLGAYMANNHSKILVRELKKMLEDGVDMGYISEKDRKDILAFIK